MGTAFYYAKIWYAEREDISNEGLLINKELELKSLLLEGMKAQDWWQDNRWHEHEYNKTGDHRWRGMFWAKFTMMFPNISEYLAQEFTDYHGVVHSKLYGDCSNGLAGKLDFGHDPEELDYNLSYVTSECCVGYTSEVWHLADWDTMIEWLARKTGAIGYSWISDEEVNLFDLMHKDGMATLD